MTMLKHPPEPEALVARASAVGFAAGGTSNDYDFGAYEFVPTTVASAGDHTITGFAGGEPGRILIIANQGGRLILKHANTGSAAGNRLSNLNGGDVYLNPFGRATYVYDDVTNVWYQVAGSLQGNVSLAYTGASSIGPFGSGVGVVGIGEAVTPPSSNPSAGGILYVDGGVLKFRDPTVGISFLAPYMDDLVIRYDGSNYATFAVGLTGSLDITSVGTSPGIILNNATYVIGDLDVTAGRVKAGILEASGSGTPQLLVEYDDNNYLAVTLSSAGAVTYDAVGTGAAHSFSDPVAINGGLVLAHNSVSTGTTLSSAYHHVTVTAACTITLPPASTAPAGRTFKVHADVDNVVVDDIEGVNFTMMAGETVDVYSDGTWWKV